MLLPQVCIGPAPEDGSPVATPVSPVDPGSGGGGGKPGEGGDLLAPPGALANSVERLAAGASWPCARMDRVVMW